MVIVWGNFHKWLIDFKTLWWRTGWTILLPPILNLNLTLFTVFPIQLALLSQRVSPRCNPSTFSAQNRNSINHCFSLILQLKSYSPILQLVTKWSKRTVQLVPGSLEMKMVQLLGNLFYLLLLVSFSDCLKVNLIVLFLNQNNSLVGCFTQFNLCPGRCSHLKRTVEKRTHLARSLSSP